MKNTLIKSWRWFGPGDNVSLQWLRKNGVEEVVTALHQVPNGEIWALEEIQQLKSQIEAAGLGWTVVESLPVTEAIKTASALRGQHAQNYKVSLQNLAACGITTVVYNFMPVLDWARTHLHHNIGGLGETMLFDYPTFAAFDVFILKRPGAAKDYPKALLRAAQIAFDNMAPVEAETLAHNIIVLTQGFIDGVIDASAEDYKAEFLAHLLRYKNIGDKQLRDNLSWFLGQVIPTAEKVGIKLAIHPDDPPFPVLGLPRIFGTMADIEWLETVSTSPSNGLTFCSGSFSARADNDVPKMAHRFAHRIHFAHLRNTVVLPDGSFYESGHSNGRVNMQALVQVLLDETERRRANGNNDYRIAMRPDHGLVCKEDTGLRANPGYPKFGRLKGLQEITQIENMLVGDG